MGESSYEKVYERMFAHRQCKALIAAIPAKLEQVHIVDVDFYLIRPDEVGKPARAEPRFLVPTPSGTVRTDNGGVWIDLGLGGQVAKDLAASLFGQKDGVPTYFCRKEVVLGVESRKKTDSFPEWLNNKVRNMFEDAVKDVQARIQEEYRDWIGSEYVERKRREFMVKSAIEDIKRALGAYDHLGKDVLKEAIDEYLVHDICSC